MNDLYHYVGNDLLPTVAGDLMPVDGTLRGQQRILRRLITNPGDYIWHPTYGAGLPARVGDVIDVAAVRAIIRSQLALEDVVAKSPAPIIDVQAIDRGISVELFYTDALTNTPQTLSFDVNR